MTPTKFKEQNVVFAENQPEYLPLPAHKTEDGRVVSCWSLSWSERLKVLLFGRLYLMQHTFNAPLQPQLPLIDSPFIED